MTTWIVFGERVLGEVEAHNRDQADIQAGRMFPAYTRVQSRASYEVGLSERRAGVPPGWSRFQELGEEDGS